MAPDVLRAAIPACLMFVGAAHANERSAELVNSFQIFCTLAPLDFAALDAKATAMKLVVRKDVGTPRQPGQFAHSKSWLVPLKGGAHELVAGEARGPSGEVLSCGVGADNVDGEEMKQELIKTMKLGQPSRETATADGAQRLTSWRYADDGVPRTYRRKEVRCCARDGGRSSGAGRQGQAPNHRKLRWSRAVVVSVAEKAGHDPVRCGSERRAKANRR
jgi:hypothetical protein